MAKELKQPEPVVVPGEGDAQGPPKSYRLHLALGFASLILFQMILLFLLLPAPAVPPHQHGYPPGGVNPLFDDPPLPAPELGPREQLVERQIGTEPLSIRRPRGDLNETFTLTMHVTVRSREQHRFDREYEQRMRRVIASVENEMSRATPEERVEVGYVTLAERSRRAINEVLGTPWVQQVYITSATYEVN